MVESSLLSYLQGRGDAVLKSTAEVRATLEGSYIFNALSLRCRKDDGKNRKGRCKRKQQGQAHGLSGSPRHLRQGQHGGALRICAVNQEPNCRKYGKKRKKSSKPAIKRNTAPTSVIGESRSKVKCGSRMPALIT